MSHTNIPDRPNVLFLMCDEHRADVAGFAGDPIVRTPTLDWMAETGVVFTSAYTPSPMPSRRSRKGNDVWRRQLAAEQVLRRPQVSTQEATWPTTAFKAKTLSPTTPFPIR